MYNDGQQGGGGYRGGGGGNYGGGNGGGFAPKPKVQGNWACGTCGAPITELPFTPDPNRLNTLKCFDCHKKSVAERGGGYRGGGGGGGNFGGGNGGNYRRF